MVNSTLGSMVLPVPGLVSGLMDWYQGKQVARYTPEDGLWRPVTERCSILTGYNALELERLRALIGEFRYQKRFLSADGQPLDETLVLSVATQACLPVLELSLDWYRGWEQIHICLTADVSGDASGDASGSDQEVPPGSPGPLTVDGCGPDQEGDRECAPVLHFEDVQKDQENKALEKGSENRLVIYEFVRHFYGLEGIMRGDAPLPANIDSRHWVSVWKQTGVDMLRSMRASTEISMAGGQDVDTNDGTAQIEGSQGFGWHGSDSLQGLFAVCSEAFFANPTHLWQHYPQVYQQLRLFYHQDPLARMSASSH